MYSFLAPHKPENYRGIALSSHFSKLFCTVLNSRLYTYFEKNNIIPVHQIGFQKKSRTADHILTLKTLIDKYLNDGAKKYLHVCFVDFKRAFDSVWRQALIYKLLVSGVSGNLLSILASMYKDVNYCVKTDVGFTHPFSSNIGVKQGCVLSPTLFNLYVADLPEIFSDN